MNLKLIGSLILNATLISRIFSHPNVLPVVGCCNHPPNLVVITQYLPYGSLFNLLHQDSGIVVDTAQALKFALDMARGMAFIHSLEKLVPNLYLSSKHVMVSRLGTIYLSSKHIVVSCL